MTFSKKFLIFVHLINTIRFLRFFISICLHAGLWVSEQWGEDHEVEEPGRSGLMVEGDRKREKLRDLGTPVLLLNYID